MPPRGNRDPNSDLRHCRGIDLRFSHDEGKFEPGAIEHFHQGEKLPQIKTIMLLLRGFAFSEAPTPSGSPLPSTPVDVLPVMVKSRGMARGCITPWQRPYWTRVP